MKFTPISKVFSRSLLTAFVMIASLNSFMSFGNYLSDEVLKSVEKHTSDYLILSNQVITYDGTATDQEGNIFGWINYGTQDWAITNAEVETYSDGTQIPQVTDATEWSNLTTGAWCYVNNDPSKGKLYNWYAVMGIYDSASLSDASLRKEFAPVGWHVPSDAEWTTFVDYLIANGYNYDGTISGNKIAKSIASTTGWNFTTIVGAPGEDPSSNNSSGFNAFPEVSRDDDGSFISEGYQAEFWSSTAFSSSYAWYRRSHYTQLGHERVSFLKVSGYSVRFVRDAVVSTSPTMEITSSDVTDGSSSNDGSISLTFTSSESTTDFDESDITVTGGAITIGSFSGTGTTYNATFTPSGDGPTTIDVAANVFTDSAGNGNSAAVQFNWTYDGIPPTIVISAQELSQGQTIINDSNLSLSFTISETTNFSLSDISSSPQGIIEDFEQVSNTEYTATFIPYGDGVISIEVVSGVFTDTAGNSNSASNEISYERDTTPPTILSISSTSPDGFYGVGDDISIKIDFSEPVILSDGVLNVILETGANDRTVTIGNTNINNTTSTNGTYSVQNGDNASTLEAKSVNISSGQLTDSAGNIISDFSFASNISSSSQINVDTTSPTLQITAKVGTTSVQDGSTTNDTSIDLTFSFSEDVTNFDANDIVYSGGNISSLTKVSDSQYTTTFTAVGDGLKSFQVSSSSYQDLAGNINSTESSFSWNYESTTFPTIQISESTGIISDGSISNNSNIILMFTASEDIKGFDSNDIQILGGEVAHGTFSDFLKLSDKLYRITFSPSSDGQKTIFIPQGSFSDLFDNVNDLAAQFNWIHDGTLPSVTSISAKSGNDDILNNSVTNDSSLEFTVIFDEDVNGFDVGDLRLTPTNQGQFSQFQAIDNKTYKFTFSPSSENEFVIFIPEDAYFDSAGNRNNQSSQFEWKYDVSPPLITISSPALNNGATTNLSEFTLLFNSNEPISGFDINDISVSSGLISGFSGISDSYSATFSADSDGPFNIQLSQGSYEDSANNSNINTSEFTFNIDNSSPSISIASNAVLNGSVTNQNSIDLSFTSNVPVENFDINDVTVNGGSLSPLTVSGNTYSSTLTVTTDGDYEIEISPSKFSDTNGNVNTVESYYSFTFDSTSPTIEISSTVSNEALTNNNNINLTFTLSESSTNFQSNDILVTGGSISGFSGSGSIYSAIFNPSSDGLITIDVNGGVFTDEAGNPNLSSSQYRFTYDGTSPSVTVSSQDVSSGQKTNDSSINLTFTLSEASTDFLFDDISVTGGSISSFNGSGSVYTAILTPSTDGLTSIDISAGSFTDQAGNTNSVSSPFIWTYDGTSPTILITSSDVDSGSLTNKSSIEFSFSISESTNNFDSSDISISGGSLSGFENTSSGYSVIFTPFSDGICSIKVDNSRFSDDVGNLNLQSNEYVFTYDGTSPTLGITSDDVSANQSTNESILFITFNFSESIAGFGVDDLDLTNGTISDFGGTGSIYTAKFSPSTDGECIIRVIPGKYSDVAGNLNSETSALVFNFDNTRPTISIGSNDISSGDSTNQSNIGIYFITNENTNDFDQNDVTTNSGTISGFSGSLKDYSAIFNSNSFGVSSIQVTADKFSDESGNLNTASGVFSWTYDATDPTLNLSGPLVFEVEAGSSYTDPGYTVSDDFDISVDVQISGDLVDLTTLGDYDVIYTATDNAGNQTLRNRIVRVQDTTPPVISLVPDTETIYLNVGDTYNLPSAILIDNHDDSPQFLQTPSLPNTSIEDVYELNWVAIDSSNNTSTASITVIVGSPPVITINPPNPYNIPLGGSYDEFGASALSSDNEILAVSIQTPDNLSTTTIRSFDVLYSATDSSNRTTTATRTVNVIDNIKPTLFFTNPGSSQNGESITWEVNTTYVDPGGVEANDNYDTSFNIIKSEFVNTSLLGEGTVYFDLTDSSGNSADRLIRVVDIVDTTPPTITLSGSSTETIIRGDSFIDVGVIVSDNYDNSTQITIIETIRNSNNEIVSSVNTNVIDTYTITYSAVDTSGNEVIQQNQVVRTVIIAPRVDASASPNPACYGDVITLGSTQTDLADGEGTPYTFEWSSTPDIGVQLGTSHIITATITQNTLFTLNVYNSNDELVGTDSSEVEVNPLPVFAVHNDLTICEGDSINLGDGVTSQTGFSYQWSSLNGFNSTLANPPPHTPISDDTFTLTVTTSEGCSDSKSFDVDVVEKPIINFSDDNFSVCEGENFVITPGIATVQFSDNYEWSVLAGNGTFNTPTSLSPIFTPSETAINAGTVTLTLTATDQSPCTGSLSESITLNITPLGSLDISPVNQVICSSENIELDIIGSNFIDSSIVASPDSAVINTSTNKIFYTPTDTDISNGYVDIFITADPLSPCTDSLISTTERITITSEAEVEISNSPLVICYDPSIPQYFSLSGIGVSISNFDSFTWEDMGGGGLFSAGNATDPMSWSYQPGSTAITNKTTQLKLTAVPNSPCSSTPEMEAFLTVIVDQNPEIILKTGDKILCEGIYNEITADIVDFNNDSQSTFAWTGGDGTFVSSSSKFPFYRPGPTDLSTGVVTLSVTVSPESGGCNTDVSQSIEFTVNKNKTVNLGSDLEMCETDGTIFLTGDFITDSDSPPNIFAPTSGVTWEILNGDGDGTFSETTTLNPVYTPGTQDIDKGQVTLQMTYSDGFCNNVSDTVTINIIRAPFAEIGGDFDICAGESTVITGTTIRPVGASIQWSIVPSASGVSLQNDTSLFPTLTADASASGSFELKLEVNPEIIDGVSCGVQIVKTVNVNVVSLPTVELAGTPIICADEDFSFDPSQITISVDNASGYVWSSNGNGTFDGGNLTSTLERPTYTPGSEDIANGSVVLRLDVQPIAPCPTGNYFDTISLEITPTPNISAPPFIEYCVDETPISLALQDYVSVANENEFTYQWTSSTGDASGTFTNNQILRTDYSPSTHDVSLGVIILYLEATSTDCDATDNQAIEIRFIDKPVVDAGPDTVTICETEPYQANGQYTYEGTGGASHSWSRGSGDGYFGSPGNFTSTQTDPVYYPGPNDLLNGVNLIFTVATTGVCEEEVSDQVFVTFAPGPEMQLGPDIEVCADKNIQLATFSVNEHVDPSSYFWSGGTGTWSSTSSLTPTYTPSLQDLDAGTIQISLSIDGLDPCLGTITRTQNITFIPPPTAEAGPEVTICETGSVIDIQGSVTEPVTNFSEYEWTIVDGPTFGTLNDSNTLTPEFIPAAPAVTQGFATLQLTVYPINHDTCVQDSGYCCGVATDTVKVNLQQAPVITLPSNQVICQTDDFTIFSDQVTISNIPSYSIEWISDGLGTLTNFNSLTPTYTPLSTETGDVTLSMIITPETPTVCTGVDPIVNNLVLTLEPLPIVTAGDDVTLCQGEAYTTLSADVDFTTDFKWTHDGFGNFTPNSSSENVTYTPDNQDYTRGFVILTLTATPEGNCTGKPDVVDSFRIDYTPPPTVEVKFDTNQDGVEEYSSSFCASETYTFDPNQVVGQNVVSYNWETVGGDGTFSDSTDEQTPTYTPGPGDIAKGSVTMKVTGVGQAGSTSSACAVDEFVFDLTILVEPTLELSNSPTLVCIDSTINLLAETNLLNGQYGVSWTVDPADGLITQGGNSLTPTFEPIRIGNVDISATLTSNDPCATQDITKTISVEVVGLPEITLFPENRQVCYNDRYTVSGVTTNAFVDRVEWEARDENGNEVGYFSDSSSLIPIYTPESFSSNGISDNQVVILSMTAYPISGCIIPGTENEKQNSITKSFNLTLTPAPKVNNIETLWGTASVCAGEDDLYTTEIADIVHYESYQWDSSGSGEWFNRDTTQPSYRPSQDEIDAGQFTLTLTVGGQGICEPLIESKTISIVSIPVVDLPTTVEVCHPASPFDPVIGFELTSDVLSNFAPSPESSTGVKWSTTVGTGYFSNNLLYSDSNVNDLGDPTNGYSTIYYPSSEDYSNGQVSITLTAYPEDPCSVSISDTMILTFTEEPTVNVGGPYSVCENGTSIQLDGSVANGNGLSWSSITNGVFEDTGGSSSGLTNAVYQLGSDDLINGSVTLTLTAGGEGVCGPISETVVIPITKTPSIEDSIGDLSLCLGEPHVFNGISIANYESYVWTTTGKGTFTNKSSAIGGVPTYTPDPNDLDEGTVYFDVTITPSDPCTEQLTFRKTITYVAPVVVDLGESFEFCQDEGSTFTIDPIVENYSSVQWSIAAFKGTGTLTNATSPTVEYTPSNEDWEVGSVTLELNVQPLPLDVCGSVTREIIVDLIGLPTIDAGNSDTICLDETHTITGIVANNYDIFDWQHNGNGQLIVDPTDPTNLQYDPDESDIEVTLTLTLTNEHDTTKTGGCDMVSSDTVILTISPEPTADAGPDITVCEGEEIDLSGSSTNAVSVEWTAYYNDTYNSTKEVVSGIFTPVDSEVTTFIPASESVYTSAIARGGIIMELTAEAQNSCGEISSTSLIRFDQKPVIRAGLDTDSDGLTDDYNVCEGDIIELSAVSPSVTFGTNYNWSRINSDGDFSGNTTSSVLEPTFTPGQQDISDGFVILRLSADPINACSTISDEDFYDEIRINITRQPTLEFSNNEFFECAGYEDEVFGPQPTRFEIPGVSTNYSENINWTIISPASGAGDFEPGTNSLINPTFEINPSFSGQIVLQAIVTAPGACDNRVDTDFDGDLNDEDQSLVATIAKQLTINVSPIAELEFNNEFENEAGLNVKGEVVCAGANSYTLNNNASFSNIGTVIWSENGSGTITSGGETLTPTYVPGVGEVGDITFTVTANAVGECDYSIERTYILRIVGSPNVSFNPIAPVCSNEDIIVSGVSTNSAQLTFESTGSGGIFYDPNDSTKASDPTIDISVADQSNYNFNWRYEPSDSDKLNPNGISIIVRATPLGDSNCGEEAIDVINIQFSPAPEVSAMLGNSPHNVSICANESFDLIEASAENVSYYSWETSGSGTFEPSRETLNPIYVPSDEDRNLNQPIILTLTGLGFENCAQVSDTIELSIDNLPNVEIPNSIYVHCEDTNLSLSDLNVFAQNIGNVEWSSSSNGQFDIDPVYPTDPLKPIYTINASDIAAGEVTLFIRAYGDGQCQESFNEDQVVIQLSKQPEVSYIVNGVTPPFLEICEGEESITLSNAFYNNVDITNGIKWSHNGSGYFDSDNIENPTYFPSEADFISGTITLNVVVSNSGNCPSAPLSLDLNLINQPSIVSDQTYYTVCYQEIGTEALISGVQDITNYSSYQWTVVDGEGDFENENTFTPTYIPGGDDFEGDRKVRVLLTVYPETGCNFAPITKGFEIEFIPQVEAYAGLGGTICSNEPFQIQGAYVNNAVSFTWQTSGDGSFNNPNLINPIYTPGSNDIENARLNGTPISLTLTANGVSIENDSANDCLVDSQTINITVEGDISVYAGPDFYLCTDESFIELNNATASGNPLVSWRNDLDNSNTNFDDPTAIKPKYYPTQSDIDRGFVTLKITGESVSGCSQNDFDKITITFVPAVDAVDQDGNPLSSAGEDDNVCAGDTYIVQDAFVNENSWETIQWEQTGGLGTLFNINSLNPEYRSVTGDNPTVTLKMTVTSKQDGCLATTHPFTKVLTITGDITGNGLISPSNSQACEGSTVLYSVTNLAGAVDYKWTIPTGASIISGDGTSNIEVLFDDVDQTQSSEISVRASNNCPGQVRVLSLPITISAKPELTLATDNDTNQVLCFGDSLVPIEYIFSGGTDRGQLSIEWFDNTGNSTSQPQGFNTSITSNSFIIEGIANQNLNSDNTYTYELKAEISGCPSLETIKTGAIKLSASPLLSLIDPSSNDQEFCEGNSIDAIEYQLLNGADNVQFQWTSPNVPNGLTQTLSAGVYKIEGEPNSQAASSEYTYQIIPVNSTTGCLGTAVTGVITVNATSSVLPINAAAENQSVCEGNPIVPIEYSIGNGASASGITVTWTEDGNNITGNPPGIGYNITDNQLVIGGNLTSNIVSTKTYMYNINASGGTCGPGSRSGTIVVNPGPRITLSNTTTGSVSQIKCEGDAIDPIVFNLLDGATNPSVSGLPIGVSFSPSVNNTITISGTLDPSNPNDNYSFTVTADGPSGGCSASIGGVLTISREDVLTPMSDISQSVCEGEDINLIRYDYSGGAVGVTVSWTVDGIPTTLTPNGLIINNADGILTISGKPSANITSSSEIGYTVETTNSGCTPAKSYSGIISIAPKPVLLINSGTNTQTICEGEALTDIVIDSAQGANNAIITWDIQPPGINGQFDSTTGQFIISGTPSGVDEDTTYIYSVKAINSIDGCESDSFEGGITVLNGHSLQLISGSSSRNQTLCEGEELPLPISYEFGGGAIAARVLGLPPGLNWSITDNRIIITGTPTVNVSVSSTNDYSYTVETIGASCGSATENGVISLVPNPRLQLINSGTNTQTICEGEPLTEIVYSTFDGAENVNITWDEQPPGIFGQFETTTGQYKISGTPSGLVEDKVYNYTVRAINLTNNCISSELTGSISVLNGHDLKLLSGSTSTNQNLCEGLELSQDIVYEFGGGANSARVLGLPPGIGWTISGNILTISGTATENITTQTAYAYTVETLGNICSTPPPPLGGLITINPDAEITLSTTSSSTNQFICEGESIDPITYTFGGGTVDAVASGLPPGLTENYNPTTRIMTISGTPTQNVEVDTSYDYTVRALNDQGCESPELTGKITVRANAELTLLSSTNTIDQTVCVDSNISDIRIRFKNSSVPSADNLPSGLSSEVVGTDVLRIYGSVSVGGPYNFNVIGTNTNGCSSTAVTVDLTIVPNYLINPTRVVLDMNDPANGTDESLVKNISCFGNSDGEIKVNLSSNASGLSYIYSWSGPNNYANTTQSNHIKNLKPGNYTVSVYPQGNSDCPVTESFTVLQPNPTDISINTISPVSCTGSDDGLISVSITGGNSFYFKNYIWEVLEEDENCVTYTIKLRDTDNDGIFDIEDADIDNDGVTDPNKSDSNGDGIVDEANGGNFSYSIVSYQSCDGTFITDNKQRRSDFSANGVYQICAVPNSVSSDANLDHDLDANTPNISSVVVSGGTASCSSGSWQKIERLKGTTYADNLSAGLYRLTVIEGPDLADIESLELDDLRNDPDVCITDQIFELPKDQILYGSVRVDEAYCSLTGGYIDIDVNQSAGEVYFYYDGVRIPSSDISIIAAEFGINTHRVLISAPVSEASFEIRNANGCGVIVAQDLLDTSVLPPIINYTSPELEKYGTISERSNVLFTLANNTSYFNVEWDFGDASPIVVGERVSHQYFADGTYTVTVYVYNASGCFTTTTQEIVVGKGYTILMPNAFSPNGDNINEIIGPVFTGLKAVDFFVFNKQGILVYEESVSEDNLSENGLIEIKGWDGTNSDPSSNFYVYKILGIRINDEVVTKTGTIFLIE